jgi:hypothetical protein
MRCCGVQSRKPVGIPTELEGCMHMHGQTCGGAHVVKPTEPCYIRPLALRLGV